MKGQKYGTYHISCLPSRVFDDSRRKTMLCSKFSMRLWKKTTFLKCPSFIFLAVVPVAAATMTPVPLLGALCYYKFRDRFGKKEEGSKSKKCHVCQNAKLVPFFMHLSRRWGWECGEEASGRGGRGQQHHPAERLQPEAHLQEVQQHCHRGGEWSLGEKMRT